MPILPSRIQDLLDFFDQHSPVWLANAAAIGLTPLQANAFKTAAMAARSAYTDQLSAVQASRDSTLSQQAATGAARAQCGELMNIIKAFAQTQGKPDVVYALAQIPPPGLPGPVPPPGLPTGIRASLEPDGAVTLRWKCANPPGVSGTVYNLRRRLGSGAWSPVGVVGVRAFTDETLPQGSSVAQYAIQGQRGTSVGPECSPFTVQFGTGGPGLTITAQFSGSGPAQRAA